MSRLATERRFHDEEARLRAATFAREPRRLQFDDDQYLDHEPWVRPALARLGDVRGRRVLDLGCGHGMAAVVLARRGAQVTACDLSPGYVAEARQRATANRVNIRFAVLDAERLPFADRSFDSIWGHAILHHLDIVTAAREIRRVLRPGGVAVFCEPWNGNPLLRLARRWRRHTPDETPLQRTDIVTLRREFAQVNVDGWQLLSMPQYCGALAPVDLRLLKLIPALRHWCRYVVVTLK
jgi:SAM-dependent methyltransferase